MTHWAEKLLGSGWIIAVVAAFFLPDLYKDLALTVAAYLLVATLAYAASVISIRSTGDLLKNAILASLLLAFIMASYSGNLDRAMLASFWPLAVTMASGVVAAGVTKRVRHGRKSHGQPGYDQRLLDPLFSSRVVFCCLWERSSPPATRIVLDLSDGSVLTFACESSTISITNEPSIDLRQSGFVFRRGYRAASNDELRSLFLRLWTKATNGGTYEKKEWQELGRRIGVA